MPPVNSVDRKKRYHQKDVNGCVSCKSRHSRCDLRRPSCYKCILADRECLYDNPRSKVLVEPPQTSQLDHLYNDVFRNGINDPRQQRALDYFMDRTRKDLAGFTSFTDRFWNTLIPHLSITEPTFRHLAIAIATRHELTWGKPADIDSLQDFCSQHHCLALDLLSKLDATRHADLLLLSCIAFIAFERMNDITGMDARYLPYVLAGLKILRERRAAPSQNLLPSSNLIDTFIEPMFLQIELMFSMFCAPTRVLGNEKEWTASSQPEIPDQFTSISQARATFLQICIWRYHPSMTSQPWDKHSAPFQTILSLLVNWYQALDTLVTSTPTPDNTADFLNKVNALRQQTCLFVGAVLYSVQDEISLGACCYPTLVDLRNTEKMQMYVRIPATRRINLTAINGSKLCDASDTETRILPRAKRVHGDGVDDSILLEFMR